MIFNAECISFALVILMTAYATQRIAAPVEKESLIRIDMKFTAAKAGRNLVSGRELCCCCIEIRVIKPVP